MDPIVAGTIVQSSGNLITDVMNRAFAKKDAQRTLDMNKELADYQYSKDLEMWNKGNQYNSPQEQMARLKAAGLNPNLVYGSGTVAGQSAGQLPKYNAPTADFSKMGSIRMPELGTILGQFLDLEKTRATTDQIKEQVNLQKQEYQMNWIKDQINRGNAKKISQDIEQSKTMFPELLSSIKQRQEIDLADSNMRIERWEKDKPIKDWLLTKIKGDIDIQKL